MAESKKEKKKYWKHEYAEHKKVSRAYISQLVKKKKLKMGKINGIECVMNCEENDNLFLKPKHNAKRLVTNEPTGEN